MSFDDVSLAAEFRKNVKRIKDLKLLIEILEDENKRILARVPNVFDYFDAKEDFMGVKP